MRADTDMDTAMDNFLPLYQAFDALFPIGAYTLSGGMETYTQKGIVKDKSTLLAYLKAQLYLLPYNDLGIAAKVAESGDFPLFDGLCTAMKQPCEIRLGSEKLCTRFLKAQNALFSYSLLEDYRKAIREGRCKGHYCVAVGLLLRSLALNRQESGLQKALELYCYSLLSAMVNHGVKLIPLGQMDGQTALFEAMGEIPAAVSKAVLAEFEELGVSGSGFDLRSMEHEALAGRLYIS